MTIRSCIIGAFAFLAVLLLAAPPLAAQDPWPLDDDEYWDPNTLNEIDKNEYMWKAWRQMVVEDWEYDAGPHCTKKNQNHILTTMDNDTFHTAQPRKWVRGQYREQHNVVINAKLLSWEKLGVVMHESMHHWDSVTNYGGFSDGHDEPEGVVACVPFADDDDDDDDDGGGGGDTGGGSGTWIWVPAETEEVCDAADQGDWNCVWVSSGNPDDGGGYYHCTGCCSTDICWDKIVTPGHWVWAET